MNGPNVLPFNSPAKKPIKFDLQGLGIHVFVRQKKVKKYDGLGMTDEIVGHINFTYPCSAAYCLSKPCTP